MNRIFFLIAELAGFDYHLFAHNKPRAILNARLVLHRAEEQKDAIHFNSLDRICTEESDQLEFIDADLLADILRRGVNDRNSLAIRKILARARKDDQGRWTVPVKYSQIDQGRCVTNHGLQSLPREYRGVVAQGYTDVDFVNCGYYIMRGLMRGLGLPCPAIEHYIANRDACLRELGGLDSKKQFIAVLNGATPHGACATLHSISGEVRALYDRIEHTEKYIAHTEMCVAREQKKQGMTAGQTIAHLEQMRLYARPDTYEDKRACLSLEGALAKRRYMASYVSNKCFQVESRLLDSLISTVRAKLNRKPAVVKMFDGCMFHDTTVDELDLPAIEQAILRDTGYPMRLKIKPLRDERYHLAVPESSFVGLTTQEMEGVDAMLDEYPAVYPGLPIEMTASVNVGEARLTNNQALSFVRLEVKDDMRYFILADVGGVEHALAEKQARMCSRPAFCITAHKSQGRTLAGAVAIHQFMEKKDNGDWLVEPEWRYVALTRSTKPESVAVM